MCYRERVERLARALKLTPSTTNFDLHYAWDGDRKWHLTGGAEGSKVLPRTYNRPNVWDALDAAEGWLAPELAALEVTT